MEKLENLKEKLNRITKKLVDISLYILGIVVAFVIGFYCNQLNDYYQTKTNKFSKPYSTKNISVAVTDHNELLMIDRNNQSINVYQDSVGFMIFKLYVNRLTSETNAK